MLDPVQLVKVGQFVTITLEQGTVRIKTVAKALESGSFGQTIRVKNEATKDVFQVVLTGPQTATMNLGTPVASATPLAQDSAAHGAPDSAAAPAAARAGADRTLGRR